MCVCVCEVNAARGSDGFSIVIGGIDWSSSSIRRFERKRELIGAVEFNGSDAFIVDHAVVREL